MINTFIYKALARIDHIDQCIGYLFSAISLILKNDILILMISRGKENILYCSFSNKVKRTHYSEFVKFCLPNHLEYFKNVNTDDFREVFIRSVDPKLFEEADLSNRKISSYYFSLLIDKNGNDVATIHLGNFINNFFTNDLIRSRLDNFFAVSSDILGKALEYHEMVKYQQGLREVFSKFVPENLIDEMMREESPDTGAQRMDICVLFSDIRSFTTISEKNSAEKVVSFLNRYFNVMVRCIREEGGIIDKFIGDAVVAIFSLKETEENISLKAVNAARKMISHLPTIDTKGLVLPEIGFNIGIGIHFGNSIVGNIGSDEKMDFTTIGEVATIAEELEGLTKQHGVNILFSESVFNNISDKTACREVGMFSRKEKQIRIFTLT